VVGAGGLVDRHSGAGQAACVLHHAEHSSSRVERSACSCMGCMVAWLHAGNCLFNAWLHGCMHTESVDTAGCASCKFHGSVSFGGMAGSWRWGRGHDRSWLYGDARWRAYCYKRVITGFPLQPGLAAQHHTSSFPSCAHRELCTLHPVGLLVMTAHLRVTQEQLIAYHCMVRGVSRLL